MIIGLIFLSQMPESPRFLVATKKFEQAREVFAWIGKVNGLAPETIAERLNEIHFDGEQLRDNSVVVKHFRKNSHDEDSKNGTFKMIDEADHHKKLIDESKKTNKTMVPSRFSFGYNGAMQRTSLMKETFRQRFGLTEKNG